MRITISTIIFLLSVNVSAEFISHKGTVDYYESKSDYYMKACSNGDTNRCVDLGMLYITGNSVEKNHKKAEAIFLTACKKKHSKACYHLGSIYKRGMDKKKSNALVLSHSNDGSAQDIEAIEKDLEKSKKFYSLGCMYGYAQSCDQFEMIKDKAGAKGSGSESNSYRYYADEIW